MAQLSQKFESGAGPQSDALPPGLIEAVERERDARGAWMRVRQHVEACHTSGAPVPEPLLRMERALALECTAESQGR